MSRHLYDVYQISQTEHAKDAINNQMLYETIVKHRQRYTRVGGVNYNLHQPQSLNPIPPEEFKESWKKDYQIMQEQLIYGDSPSFEELMTGIQTFVDKINKLEWKMNIEFPVPNND